MPIAKMEYIDIAARWLRHNISTLWFRAKVLALIDSNSIRKVASIVECAERLQIIRYRAQLGE